MYASPWDISKAEFRKERSKSIAQALRSSLLHDSIPCCEPRKLAFLSVFADDRKKQRGHRSIVFPFDHVDYHTAVQQHVVQVSLCADVIYSGAELLSAQPV
ncbi:MAG: hypothetical protein ACI4OB_05740 [Christensenellales bacterium]